MTSIIPFDGSAKLPAYLANKAALSVINQDVMSAGATFGVLSIKGKVFTLVKGSEKKVLTREIDGEIESVQSVTMTVVRANTKSRVFYAKAYSEGDSDGAKPTCFSHDGITPDAAAKEPQFKKCQGCSQNVWGVRDGKGTACSVNTRLAVVDPQNLTEPVLLRVPAASRKGFADAVSAAENRSIPYNALVIRMAFDKEAPSPKITFKPTGLLDDATYAKISALYEDDLTMDIVGVPHSKAESTEPEVDTSELDAAIAARKAVQTAKTLPSPKAEEPPAPVEEPKPAPKVEEPKKPAAPKAKKVAPASDADDLLGDLDSLLSSSDD